MKREERELIKYVSNPKENTIRHHSYVRRQGRAQGGSLDGHFNQFK